MQITRSRSRAIMCCTAQTAFRGCVCCCSPPGKTQRRHLYGPTTQHPLLAQLITQHGFTDRHAQRNSCMSSVTNTHAMAFIMNCTPYTLLQLGRFSHMCAVTKKAASASTCATQSKSSSSLRHTTCPPKESGHPNGPRVAKHSSTTHEK